MQRTFRTLRAIEGALLATAMIAIAVLTVAGVFARNLFGGNLAAAEELTQFLIVLICFVGLSYAAGQGRHIRMTALVDAAGPGTRKVLAVASSAVTAALMFFLGVYSLRYAVSVDRVSPVLGVPLGAAYLVAPIGLFLTGAQYLLAVARNLTSEGVWLAWDVREVRAGADAPSGEALSDDASPEERGREA